VSNRDKKTLDKGKKVRILSIIEGGRIPSVGFYKRPTDMTEPTHDAWREGRKLEPTKKGGLERGGICEKKGFVFIDNQGRGGGKLILFHPGWEKMSKGGVGEVTNRTGGGRCGVREAGWQGNPECVGGVTW